MQLTKLNIFSLLLAGLLAGCGSGGESSGKGGGSGAKCVNSGGCGPAEYCAFDDFTCGSAEGRCRATPISCELEPVSSVCSCSGITFFNSCWAGASGQSVKALGDCP